MAKVIQEPRVRDGAVQLVQELVKDPQVRPAYDLPHHQPSGRHRPQPMWMALSFSEETGRI